ncbi:MAG TPA: hypothetical protein VGX48_05525, partial [Pyrinomonadaceae bacterium]|nr:hypothetical protein [Pyrinomonadaceae bacterium]
AAARLTLKALAAGAVEAGFNLPLRAAAMRACIHVKRYIIISADLGNPRRLASCLLPFPFVNFEGGQQ